jgi:hypothetical protein
MAARQAVFLGSWNGGFTFQGYIAQLAVLKNIVLADRVIPPAAFAGINGFWWNGDLTGSKISYGNVLQNEYTQPFTAIAAVCRFAAAGGGHNGVSGIIFTNVTAGTPFPGHEFWIDGNGKLTTRIINNASTALIDVNGSTFLADGKWHVVAMIYDGSGRAAGVNLHLDGVAETMTTVADTLGGQSIVSAGQNYMIGNQQSENFAMLGAIGLSRQYNVVKSQAFIQQFKINQLIPAIDFSCVLAPKLNEGGSNTTTGDLSASGLTGTLSSASVWLRG